MFDVATAQEATMQGFDTPARPTMTRLHSFNLDCATVAGGIPVPEGAWIVYDPERRENIAHGKLIAVVGRRGRADPPAPSGVTHGYRVAIGELRAGGLWLFGPGDGGRMVKWPNNNWGIMGVIVKIDTHIPLRS